MRRTQEHNSFGVACIKISDNAPMRILLVRKRYTYAFAEFVAGKYHSGNDEKIITLLSGMTVEEKIDILSRNFHQLWYRVWLSRRPKKHTTFLICKNKFENAFCMDDGARIRRLINRSAHSKPIWEIPKGRKKNKSESDITCAVREFAEETNIQKKSYRISDNAVRYAFTDAGVRYINTYYVAITRNDVIAQIRFSNDEQIGEVSDIGWFTYSEALALGLSAGALEAIKNCMTIAKR